MIGAWTVLLFVIAMGCVFVYGEVQCYRQGGDVWNWTAKLARWLDKFAK